MSILENQDITIKTGTRVKFRVTVTDSTTGLAFDLSDFTARCQAREQKSTDANLLATFTTNIPAPASDGFIDCELGASASGALTVPTMFYDVEIEQTSGPADPENVQRVAQGRMLLDFEVSQ